MVVVLGCSERSLVGENNLNIPDSSYTASSYFNGQYKPYNALAKLIGTHGWAPRHNYNPYLQIDLGTQRVITAVATQGSGDKPEWMTKYKLNFINDISEWKGYEDVNWQHKVRKMLLIAKEQHIK
jgi:hypothetical protein